MKKTIARLEPGDHIQVPDDTRTGTVVYVERRVHVVNRQTRWDFRVRLDDAAYNPDAHDPNAFATGHVTCHNYRGRAEVRLVSEEDTET